VNDALDKMLQMAASPEGKSVLLDLCSVFVSAAVGTYLDKTQDANSVFDDFFAAATRASNREAMQDIAGRVTGETVRTMVEVLSPHSAQSRGAAARRSESRAAYARDSGGHRGDGSVHNGGRLSTPESIVHTVGAAHAHVGLVTPGAQSVFQTFELGGGGDDMSEESHGVNGSAGALDGSKHVIAGWFGRYRVLEHADTECPGARGGGVHLGAVLRPGTPVLQGCRRARGQEPHRGGCRDVHGVGGAFVRVISTGLRVRHVQGWADVGDGVFRQRGAGGFDRFAFFWLVASARLAAAYVLVGFGGEQSAVAAATEVAPLLKAAGEAVGGGAEHAYPWYAWSGLVAPVAFILRWANGAAAKAPTRASSTPRSQPKSRNQDYVLSRLQSDVTY
jgi:hypothetical protein